MSSLPGRRAKMPVRVLLAVCVLALGPVGCRKTESAKAVASAAPAAAYVWGLPDPGGVEQISVKSSGKARTRPAAVNDALRNAVMQGGGADVSGTSAQGPTGELSLAYNESGLMGKSETLDIRASSFHDNLLTSYGGRVTSFSIVAERSNADGFEVDIEAQIPRFKPPASNRVKLVIAPPRATESRFAIDGGSVDALRVADSIRSGVLQVLTRSGRVDVLERQYDAELQSELAKLSDGSSTRESSARLGQRLAADFVWVATIERFSVTRSVRELRIGGGRRLESISGEAQMSHRLVNVATGQVLFSDTATAEGPRVAPTTLGASVSADDAVAKMSADLVARASTQVMGRLFPVVVLSRTGEAVVLSQGKGALVAGRSYRLVVLGEPLIDPQTGQSLGFSENDGGEVSITRVSERVAYGALKAGASLPARIAPGQVQLGEEVVPSSSAAGSASDSSGSNGRRMQGGAAPRSQAGDEDDGDVDFDLDAKPKKPAPKPKG